MLGVALLAALWAGGCNYLGGGSTTTSSSTSNNSENASSSNSSSESASDDSNASESEESTSQETSSKSPSESAPEGKVENENRSDENPKRNPFAPKIEVTDEEETEDDESDRELAPLEKVSIDSLRLAAIISEVAVPKAMFIDPDGLGHLLKEGDRIGENSGVISEIRNREVVIEVPSQVDDSEPREKIVELRQTELPRAEQSSDDLSEDQKQALEELLQSEEGRQTLKESYEKVAPSGSALDNNDRRNRRQAEQDERFPGLRPPDQQ